MSHLPLQLPHSGMVVFDELDVFNGPCQTDSLVAYLDWHMDLGYLGQMIYYQSASRGQSGQPGPPQYDTSSDNKANARNYTRALLNGLAFLVHYLPQLF